MKLCRRISSMDGRIRLQNQNKSDLEMENLQITRTGQIFEEPVLFERSRPGRVGVSLPDDDSGLPFEIDSSFIRNPDDLPLPEVSEPDVVRHFTRLSTWNYGIDLNLYPLGSCTMKYNPRINEEIAAEPH